MSTCTSTGATRSLIKLGDAQMHQKNPRLTPPNAVEHNGIIERGADAHCAMHYDAELILLGRWERLFSRADRSIVYKGGGAVTEDTGTWIVPKQVRTKTRDEQIPDDLRLWYGDEETPKTYHFLLDPAIWTPEWPICIIADDEQYAQLQQSPSDLNPVRRGLQSVLK